MRRDPIRVAPGQRYGRLVVLAELPDRTKDRQRRWQCQCDCGATTVAIGPNMVKGNTSSCGCIHREGLLARNTTHGQSKTKQHTPEYTTWCNMRARCENPKSMYYANYGGRGIAVCERWQAFEHFFADMGPRPSPKHSIDRINNDLGYEPGNVRWATRTEQNRNRRDIVPIEHNGRSMLMVDWAREAGIRHQTLKSRLAHGWSFERAITEPVR